MGPRTGDKVTMGGGLVLFLAVFLPWFTLSAGGGGKHASAALVGMDLSFVSAWLPALLGLIAATAVAATTLGTARLPRIPGGWPRVVVFIGAVALVLVVHKLLVGERANGFGYTVHRTFGIYVAALAAVAVVIGGSLQVDEQRSRDAQGRRADQRPPRRRQLAAAAPPDEEQAGTTRA
jgi:hypothetical protein